MVVHTDVSLIHNLKNVSLFEGLSPDHLSRLISLCERKAVEKEQVLCYIDAPSDAMYILLSGELTVIGPHGQLIATRKPVSIVGDMGVITGCPRSATVKMSQAGEILTLDKASFESVLDDADLTNRIYRNALQFVGRTFANVNYTARTFAKANTASARLQAELYSLALTNQSLEEQARQLQQARDVAESANLAKSQFLANISHEIRTPINAILGYAQILERSEELPSKHRRAVQTIRDSGNHLLNLVNEVLDLSKIEAGRLELHLGEFDLNRALHSLEQVFNERCSDKGLNWRLEGVTKKPLLVRGDEIKITQVLINLLSNALKFTEAGEIALRLESTGQDRYLFTVTDTGIGLSLEDQAALFQPFQQGRASQCQEGSGLGLAIAHRQVELMGGELGVESNLGQGTRFAFTLELPRGQGEAPI